MWCSNMKMRGVTRWVWALLLAAVLAGCSGGDSPATQFDAPPPPLRGQTPLDPFNVNTENYFYAYSADTRPFDVRSQFANVHYPVRVSYQADTTPPDSFDLPLESELSIQSWAQADPRVSIVSGVSGGTERVKVILTDKIVYGNSTNIIGLTKLVDGSDPRYEVYVATQDPITVQPMLLSDIAKTLTHELGHAFGLGHSPDQRDLMFYRASSQQGQSRRTFLTYGDAMAIWTTLSNRRINWDPARPIITYPAQAVQPRVTRGPTVVNIEPGEDVIVCLFTR